MTGITESMPIVLVVAVALVTSRSSNGKARHAKSYNVPADAACTEYIFT